MSAKSLLEKEQEAVDFVNQAEAKLPSSKTNIAIFQEAFDLTFIAEWCDLAHKLLQLQM